MSAKKTRKVTKRAAQVVPEHGWVKKQKSKLPQFPPHQLERILQDPLLKGAIKPDSIAKLRKITDEQLDRLLGALGLKRTMPNAWERGFLLLAAVHHGVGHISWARPRGPNLHAQKWTKARDDELTGAIRGLTAQGRNESQALQEIAKDPVMCSKFGLSDKPRSEIPDRKRHFQVLKKRWTYIKKMAPLAGVLEAIVGNYPVGGTDADFAAWYATSEKIPKLKTKGKSK